MSLVIATVTIAAAPSAPACEPLRVMSYNIRLDLESDGENRWFMRRDQFIGQLLLMRPAIIGLQEVLPGQKSDLERALPDYAFLGVARDDGRSSGEYSSLAVDRRLFDVAASGTFWLSPTPNVPSRGWDAAYPRIATWARLARRSDGKRLLVLNTHLDHVGQLARLQAARQIAAFLAERRTPGDSVIVTGDLNAEPGSPPLQALTSSRLALRDSRHSARAPAIGPEGTFNGFEPVPKQSRRIDYVLVDHSVQVELYAVLALHSEGGRPASDHFPVLVDAKACAL